MKVQGGERWRKRRRGRGGKEGVQIRRETLSKHHKAVKQPTPLISASL